MQDARRTIEDAKIETIRINCGYCGAQHAKVYETMFDCALFKEAMAKPTVASTSLSPEER